MTEPYFQDRPVLTQAGAQALAEQAVRLACGRALAIVVAVVDPAGQLLAFTRMDGAPPVAVDVAIGKARTAAAIAAPSAKFEAMINQGATAMLSVPGLVPLQGGVPVFHNGRVAGAVGVSGASGVDDAALAHAAADTFLTLHSEENSHVA
ncbi:MAG: heme-binding protein [Azospirillaceae bacterium]|nr:heme-binding protein [Azospirillaceae bacterium]